MEQPSPSPFGRLTELFGERLVVERGARRIVWSCEGRRVVASLGSSGGVEARFYDRPDVDLATGDRVVAVFRARGPYATDAIGAARMVDDVVTFMRGRAADRRFALADVTLA